MGYRSDIVIGVRKEILAEDLLTGFIPKRLKEEPQIHSGDLVYWKLEGLKWYSSYPEIEAIEDFFKELSGRTQPTVDGKSVPLFGALRIGENDDDIEAWGKPGEFEIWLNRGITFPGEQ